MNTPTLHTFDNVTIRVIKIDGQPWFAAMDVRKVLGIRQSGTNLSYLRDDEKQVIRKSGQTSFKGHGLSIISESGLYKLIMRSDKPVARAFQDWVTREVLPAIRKDGGYVMGEEKVATGEMTEEELVLKAIDVMRKKIERLAAENDNMSKKLNYLTIDSYRSIDAKAYWTQSFRNRLAHYAKIVCLQNGYEIGTEYRDFRDVYGTMRKTKLNVYPKVALDEAHKMLTGRELAVA